jgi:hypothetical protein
VYDILFVFGVIIDGQINRKNLIGWF